MKRLLFSLVVLLSFTTTLVAQRVSNESFLDLSTEGPVYVIPIKDMIDGGLAAYIHRAINDAETGQAGLIVFNVDTFGGLVDAADKIRKDILNTNIPTLAFIDKNAASAGALISYAADYIVMVPGASMGAATAVDGASGDKLPEKIQSYMRGLMRATAEANGRDPQIAEAMVDETLSIPGISEAGKLLTLSSSEAARYHVADGIYNSIPKLLEANHLQNQTVVAHQETGMEKFLRFLGSPIVSSILMLMMLGGLYFELQTPGVGFAGMMALLGALLFFAPNYMNGLAENWEVLIFILGIGLLIAEIFVTPGFGFLGVGGLVLVLVGLTTSMIGNVGFSFPTNGAVLQAISTLGITMLLFIGMVLVLSKFLPESKYFSRLVLAPSLDKLEGYTAAPSHEEWIGKTGKTITPLRPSGTAQIGDQRVDVVSQGDFIVRGATVRVVRVQGSKVEVKEIPQIESV